jgi:hypothetical protein
MQSEQDENDLDRVTDDFMVDDILSTSAEMLLAEVAEDRADRGALASAFDRITLPLLSDFDNRVRSNSAAVDRSALVRFLTFHEHDLSPKQTGDIFANLPVSEIFRALRAQFFSWDLPTVAAASQGLVHERTFEGGDIHLTPSSIDGQTYLTVRFNDPPATTSQLIVEAIGGRVHRLTLPSPDSQGEVFIVLDLNNQREASLVAALHDPMAHGIVVQIPSDAR